MSIQETKVGVIIEDDVKGLDDGDCIENVYIKHINCVNIHTITTTAAIHSKLLKESIIDINNKDDNYGKTLLTPMIITVINADTIKFICDYISYYDNKVEVDAPESPLKNIHISVILGDEYHLFSGLLNNDDNLKTKITKINNYIESSLYFGCKQLTRKLCAIIANILVGVDINEFNSLK
jgi:hypothetical protein